MVMLSMAVHLPEAQARSLGGECEGRCDVVLVLFVGMGMGCDVEGVLGEGMGIGADCVEGMVDGVEGAGNVEEVGVGDAVVCVSGGDVVCCVVFGGVVERIGFVGGIGSLGGENDLGGEEPSIA